MSKIIKTPALVYIVLISLIWSVETAAETGHACRATFAAENQIGNQALPQILPRSNVISLAGKVLDVSALRLAIRVIDLNDASSSARKLISELPDDNYIYVIDAKHRLAILPRAIDPGPVDLSTANAKFIGSHEGIVRYLKATFGDSPAVLAPGEFTIRNGGKVIMLSNASGTFRGGAASLLFAVEKLKMVGLQTNSRTELRDYSTGLFSDPHTTVDVLARVQIEASRDPKFLALINETREVMRLVDQKFPSADAVVPAALAAVTRGQSSGLLTATGIFAQWLAPVEGEAYIVQNSVRSLGEVQYRDALLALRQLATQP